MMHIETISEPDDYRELWDKIDPHLNEALEALGQKDRDAVLLRFFEQRPFVEVGKNLGTSEDAAKMRVGRALEKLRSFFRKRGFVLGVTALAGAFSANAAATVPADYASSVASNVLQGGGPCGATATLAEAILRHLRMVRLKMALGVAGTLLVLGLIVGIGGYQFGWFRPKAAPAWPPPAQPWRPQ